MENLKEFPTEEDEINEFIASIIENRYSFKHEVIPVMEEVFIINDLPFKKYDLLSIACDLIDKNKLEDAKNLLKMVEGLYGNKPCTESFNQIVEALHSLIIYKEINKDEIYYQNVFKSHCKEILGKDYEIFEKKDLQRKRPDIWVIYEDEIIPIEMKMGNFNHSALKQLQDYMSIYKCAYGIAIGVKPTVDIPSNISFISLDIVKKYDT